VYKHAEVTNQVIAAFYEVYHTLGYGFSEAVYHAAMAVELRERGLHVDSEYPIVVLYKGNPTASFFADLVVNQCVLVELKAVKDLLDEHEAQILNYLKATHYEVGLLMNFGPEARFVRKAYDNQRKGTLSWLPKPNAQTQR
jgi:GxxExxY protein